MPVFSSCDSGIASLAEKDAHEKARRGLQRKEAEALAARQRADSRVEVAHYWQIGVLVLPYEFVDV